MKKIFVILFIIIAVMACIIGKKVIESKKNVVPQEEVVYSDADSIRYEIEMINKIAAGSYNQDEIDQVLNRVTTEGDYAIVEKAIKQYMKDYINMSKGVTDAIDGINLYTILSEENLTQDAPDFINTKEKLSNAKLKLEEYKTNSKNFLTEEKIKSYLTDTTISEEARSFYEDELAKMTEEDKEVIEQLDTVIDQANVIIEKEEALIDYLITNKNTWVIKDGAVAFDKEQKATEYNTILRELVAIFE